MLYLRQATSATIMAGPYVSSDGAAITGLTLTQSTFMLSRNGAAFVAKNETTSGSHRIMGYYSVMFNDTDTGTAGRLQLVSSAAAALPVWHEFTVLPSQVFDSIIIGTDLLQIDLTQIDGAATSGNNATLNLKQLNIQNNAGTAIQAFATSSGYGFEVRGGGTGHGMLVTGGWSGGTGLSTRTGSDGVGVGLSAEGQVGIYATAAGSWGFAGFEAVGPSSLHGHGIYLEGGLRGSAIRGFSGLGSASSPYAALDLIGQNSAYGANISAGNSGGVGMRLYGKMAGDGLLIQSDSGYAVSSLAGASIADAVLRRDFGSVTAVGNRSMLNALRALRNRVTTSGTVMTVYAENDSTAVWTSALTVNNSAGFIVEVDPA